MTLIFSGHTFKYEIESLCRSFFPPQKFTLEYDTLPNKENVIFTRRRAGKQKTILYTWANLSGKTSHFTACLDNSDVNYEKECERLLGIALYKVLSTLTGESPGWGILTGVRPAKLLQKFTLEQAQEKLLVKPEKYDLVTRVAKTEAPILELNTSDSFSLYVSIPFCPTRCAYCSFISHSVESVKKLIPTYLELMHKELEAVGEIARSHGLKLKTIYFGGGTPTTLSALQLHELMNTIERNFDVSSALEYTIEAGRPDTIDLDKLTAIKIGGATRISVNPQTMSDVILRHIGRSHTAAQTLEAFELARRCGFDNINMDVIAGLPTDTIEGFTQTMEQLLKLSPESLTVHTLALKRSSSLFEAGSTQSKAQMVSNMVDHAGNRLISAGYEPYYLYRQKNITGCLENVGYAKDGYAGLYNIFIMSEAHSILAVGAAGMTKLVKPNGVGVERVANYKFPFEYIDRFSEIISRKERINEFYCNI